MRGLVALLPLLTVVSGQFVFFGHQHGPVQSAVAQRQPPAPAPAPQQTREARLMVQPRPSPPAQPQRFTTRPAVTSTFGGFKTSPGDRFAPTFFRTPGLKLNHPGKHELPKSNEPAKFVTILSDPDLILTEEGGMRRSTTEAPHMAEIKKMVAMMQMEREGRLLVEDVRPEPVVSLPVFTASSPAPSPLTTTTTSPVTTTTAPVTTTPAPITTTELPPTTVVVRTMAPMRDLTTGASATRPPMTFFAATTTVPPATTTAATTMAPAPVPTTQAPMTTTTAKPMMRIISSVRSSPFTLGTPVITQMGAPRVQSPAPRAPQVQSPARTPKALSAAPPPQAKGNHQFQGKTYLLTWRMGRNNFDWRGGVSFCQSQGMRLVSLDSSQKTDHFLGLLTTDRAPYFWAGGQVRAQLSLCGSPPIDLVI